MFKFDYVRAIQRSPWAIISCSRKPFLLRKTWPGILGIGLNGFVGFWQPIQAQISPDQTLPRNSVVTQNGDRFTITGGTLTGPNLFHSFQDFSVPTNGTASFQNIGSDVDHIISRITGGRVSTIDGVIEALQSDSTVSDADFFLINPNGIVFGPNATLNLGGSFIATTAATLDFADGTEFNADGTQSSPLLTVSVPTGLQLNQPLAQKDFAGQIINESIVPLLNVAGEVVPGFTGGIQVPLDHTIALVGSDIAVQNFGTVYTESGRIELGSVASGRVQLTPIDAGWQLGYDTVEGFGPIRLDLATLDVFGDKAGSILLHGGPIDILGSVIFSEAETLGGEEIVIRGTDISVDQSTIASITYDAGRGSDILVEGDRLTLQNGGQISASTEGLGGAGNVTVNIRDDIEIAGGFLAVGPIWVASSIINFANVNASGNAGQMTLLSDTLTIKDGAVLDAATLGFGNAGRISIIASDIVLDGVVTNSDGSLFISTNGAPRRSGIFTSVENGAEGKGSQIDIQTDRLSIQNGAVIQAGTFSTERGGSIRIVASDAIELTGTGPEGNLSSNVLAASAGIPGIGFFEFPNSTGAPGDITIQTPALALADGGAIAVSSFNPETSKSAGSITIEARTISLDSQSQILAETASGAGGDLFLTITDLLTLNDNSLFSTTAGQENAGGDGGDITIDSRFISALPGANSDIRANAFIGRGGNIDITTEGLFGIQPRNEITDLSDVTASSELGVNGQIIIDTPDVDPSEGTVELPSGLVDATQLVTQGCTAPGQLTQTPQGEFVNIGRGGVASSPMERTSNDEILDDVSMPTTWASTRDITHPVATIAPIIEADGWLKNSEGYIVLAPSLSTMPITEGCR